MEFKRVRPLAAVLLATREANSYTFFMDSVRFGKALGFGARQAAKALLTAADAATSPNPSTVPAQAQEARSAPKPRVAEALSQKAARTTAQVRQTKAGLARGSKRFGEAAWGPFVKVSGVL